MCEDGRGLLLAPMAGVNDLVFRALCRKKGAQLTYTEMISSKGLLFGNQKTKEMLKALPEDRPYAVQLFGNEPEVMAAEAQKLVEVLSADLSLIDINMGCPARKVASNGSGAALLKQPELALRIVQAVSSAVDIPVTVKMRLLDNSNDSTTIAFALSVAEAGAAAITLHGRTAEQMYKGSANKQVVGLLAQQSPVPVIASGDVFGAEDIQAYQELGVKKVMIARGARGNPWIFAGEIPTLSEIVAMAREHTEQLALLEPRKLVWMRKHLAWYFKGTPRAVRVRKAVQSAVTVEDYLDILENCVP